MIHGAAVELSVVVPVYGCAGTLETLRARTSAALEAGQITHEIVFVDDASTDGAADVLASLRSRDPRVVPLLLAVNGGQHAAIAEGLGRATGGWAAVMDCDLQDPPELLPLMLRAAQQRDGIVVGRRGAHAQSWWRRIGSRAFGTISRRRLGSRLVGTHSVFSVLPRNAIDAYLTRSERTVMYLPVIESLGLPIVSFDYDRSPRGSGRSGYSAAGLLRRAARLLSHRPPNP